MDCVMTNKSWVYRDDVVNTELQCQFNPVPGVELKVKLPFLKTEADFQRLVLSLVHRLSERYGFCLTGILLLSQIEVALMLRHLFDAELGEGYSLGFLESVQVKAMDDSIDFVLCCEDSQVFISNQDLFEAFIAAKKTLEPRVGNTLDFLLREARHYGEYTYLYDIHFSPDRAKSKVGFLENDLALFWHLTALLFHSCARTFDNYAFRGTVRPDILHQQIISEFDSGIHDTQLYSEGKAWYEFTFSPNGQVATEYALPGSTIYLPCPVITITHLPGGLPC